MKNTKNAPKVESATETIDQTPATPAPEKKPTKKSIVITFLDKPEGGTIDQIAQAIVDLGIDPDLDKNKRTTRLWLSKVGFAVTKVDKSYFRAK
jgi:hypothetical protein